MPFVSIAPEQIEAGKPVDTELWQRIKDNEDFLYSVIGSGATLSVQNASFEIDSDEDGIPDMWTRHLYPGGAGAFETAAPAHGAKAYRFTHPGGAGNGGGYLESDYIEVSEYLGYTLSVIHWATAAGMKNLVQARWFTKAQIELETGSPVTLYASTANPLLPRPLAFELLVPATARYLKIRLTGGYTDTNVAGSAYFDKVSLAESARTGYAAAPSPRGTIPFALLKQIQVHRGGMWTVEFTLTAPGYGYPAYAWLYVDGVQIGPQRSTTGEIVVTETIAMQAGSVIQVYVQGQSPYPASVSNMTVTEVPHWVAATIATVNQD